jgi:hypothetical protein
VQSSTITGSHHIHLHDGHYQHAWRILEHWGRGGSDGFQTGSGQHGLPGLGSATLHGGLPIGHGPGADSVNAGIGNATMIGVGQHDSVVAGGSFTHMVAHGGTDPTIGGHSNVFAFDQSVGGGHHLIHNFADGTDKFQPLGTDSAAGGDHSHLVGGGAVINLDGGKTQIVLNGITHLGKHDFIK